MWPYGLDSSCENFQPLLQINDIIVIINKIYTENIACLTYILKNTGHL